MPEKKESRVCREIKCVAWMCGLWARCVFWERHLKVVCEKYFVCIWDLKERNDNCDKHGCFELQINSHNSQITRQINVKMANNTGTSIAYRLNDRAPKALTCMRGMVLFKNILRRNCQESTHKLCTIHILQYKSVSHYQNPVRKDHKAV